MKKTAILFFSLILIFALAIPASAIDPEAADENFFALAYEEISSHSSEILSALTCIFSLILTFTYKKGLLPTLGASLGGIGSSVDEIRMHTENGIRTALSSAERIEGQLIGISELCEALSKSVYEIDERMRELEGDKRQSEEMKIILRSQIDMLYDVFMESALPQYSKDAVGERIGKMKSLLKEEVATNEV